MLDAGFHFGKDHLRSPLVKKIGQYIGLLPQQRGFVAYSITDKMAIGFLSLTKHSSFLQSIRYVYTNPGFRRKGVAKKLVLSAFFHAQKEGAKKIFLTADPVGPVIDFYKRLGFQQISNSQVVWGEGTTKEVYNGINNILLPLKTKSQRDLTLLFKIYYSCMGKNWINFFRNNTNNFIFGYSQDFKNFFNREAYMTKKKDAFVILYKRPLSHVGYANLYISANVMITPLLGELMKLFKQKNILYSKITIFNVTSGKCYSLLEKHNFYPYSTLFLGKNLVSS